MITGAVVTFWSATILVVVLFVAVIEVRIARDPEFARERRRVRRARGQGHGAHAPIPERRTSA
jgi:hypothetical protein